MSSMNDYCLDEGKLKSGVKLSLFNRDGSLSDDYVMVRWAWDDKVKAAMDTLRRDMLKAKGSKEDKTEELTREGIISQVVSWSFTEKPTKTNIRKFLKSRPDVAERIDELSANTKVFFTDSGKSS